MSGKRRLGNDRAADIHKRMQYFTKSRGGSFENNYESTTFQIIRKIQKSDDTIGRIRVIQSVHEAQHMTLTKDSGPFSETNALCTLCVNVKSLGLIR